MVITGGKRAYGPNHIESLIGRVLVLGKKHVGKSATIVRYTTGRYIGDYGSSTSDWLYRHWLGLDEKRRVSTTIEILEQKDIPFETGANLFNSPRRVKTNDSVERENSCTSGSDLTPKTTETTTSSQQTLSDIKQIEGNNPKDENDKWSLSWRVAMDLERDEKVDLLNRIQWAHAYVVIYAVDDFESYEKAIRYLNLIAKTNYGSIYNHHSQQSPHSNNFQQKRNNSTDSSPINTDLTRPTSSSGVSSGNWHLSPQSPNQQHQQHAQQHQQQMHKSSSSSSNLSQQSSLSTGSQRDLLLQTRKPILLVANKSDLVPMGGRKVSTSEGRNLALRHQAMFSELSISNSQTEIETAFNYLFESIDSQALIPSPQQKLPKTLLKQQQLLQNNKTSGFGLEELKIATSKQQTKMIDGHRRSRCYEDSCFEEEQEDDVFIIQDSGNLHLYDQFVGSRTPPEMPDINVDGINAQKANNRNVYPITQLPNNNNSNNNYIKPPSGASSGVRPPLTFPSTLSTSSSSSSSNGSRYKNLKSSFKRASMAIVSSRTLLNSNSTGIGAEINQQKTSMTNLEQHRNQNQQQKNNDLSSSSLSKSSNSINSLAQQQYQTLSLNTFIQQASTIKQQPHLAMPVTPNANTTPTNITTPININSSSNNNNIVGYDGKKYYQRASDKLQPDTSLVEINEISASKLNGNQTLINNNSNNVTGSAAAATGRPVMNTTMATQKNGVGSKPGSKESLRENLRDSSAYYTVLVSERLKRTILKYRTRRKTVAFEPSSVNVGSKSREEIELQEEHEADGEDSSLFSNGQRNQSAASVKWSLESTNSLCNPGTLDWSSNGTNAASATGTNATKNANNAKQTGGKAATNLDRSSSALSKGDKLYYRSIFGVQRPLGNKQQQQKPKQPELPNEYNASVVSPRAGSSSSSSIMSGRESVCSLSMSLTSSLQEKTKETDHRLSSNQDGDQYLATALNLNQSQGALIRNPSTTTTPPTTMKRQSTVRNVMNSLTRRPGKSAQKEKEKQQQQQDNKTIHQQSSLSNRKPIYVGLFGGSQLVSTPILKQSIEPISINVAHVETVGRNNFGAHLEAGFCQQL